MKTENFSSLKEEGMEGRGKEMVGDCLVGETESCGYLFSVHKRGSCQQKWGRGVKEHVLFSDLHFYFDINETLPLTFLEW